MNELLNTESIVAELRRKVDTADVQLEMKDQESRSAGLKEELLNPGSSFSITGDDLI